VIARILAIDAGNTRIKWGLHDGREWFLRGAVDTVDVAGSHAFREVWKAAAIERVVISNVAGPSVAKAIEDQIHLLDKPVCFIAATARQCGVENRHADAQTPAAGGARAQLVVVSGTALTVDALTADGHFLGGIIVPGLMLMHRALNRSTAQLPVTPGEYQTFPRSTANAISSGAVEACAGAVARMYTHLSAQAGDAPHCVGSGGSMHVLAPHLPFPVSINDNLVLDGLIAIANAA